LADRLESDRADLVWAEEKLTLTKLLIFDLPSTFDHPGCAYAVLLGRNDPSTDPPSEHGHGSQRFSALSLSGGILGSNSAAVNSRTRQAGPAKVRYQQIQINTPLSFKDVAG
jgi:hypothetical protein